MNPLIQCKTTILPLLIAGVLSCFGLLPKAAAVVPPPDGGYPGFTTAEGTKALFSLTTGSANTAVGWYSLFSNVEGSFNTATGAGSLLFNTADQNTAFGAAALLFNTTGFNNTAVGSAALSSNTTGEKNTAVGELALFNNTTGTENLALGRLAGFNQTTGNFNGYIGFGVGGVAGENNSTYIANIFNANLSTGSAVYVQGDGKLGTSISSRHFKEELKPIEAASEVVFALKPVTFRYKKEIDPNGIPQFGLVAEDVEKVNPDLVVRDKEGKPYSVRYDQVNAMLLNEFLKEHQKVEEQDRRLHQQGAMIAQQQKQIEVLTTGLQKVNAQLELSKRAPQTVKNAD
jgi:hypothetical protein